MRRITIAEMQGLLNQSQKRIHELEEKLKQATADLEYFKRTKNHAQGEAQAYLDVVEKLIQRLKP